MARYRLHQGLFVMPTPAGAFYSASAPETTPSRRLLRSLIADDRSPELRSNVLAEWIGSECEQDALEVLFHAQSLGWIEGFDAPRVPPRGPLEDVLGDLLEPLSMSRKSLLADAQGFYVATVGFAHETAEELSAVSADLDLLYGRHRRLLRNNMTLQSSAWALVDAAGNSQVGFWPLYIGEHRFVLVIGGEPRLNQPALTDLIWALSKRYAIKPGSMSAKLPGRPRRSNGDDRRENKHV